MVVLAAVAIGGIIYAILRTRDLGSVNERVLALRPDGFVKHTGVGPEATVSASYANIAKLTPAVRNSTQYLDMVTRDGRKGSVELDGRFWQTQGARPPDRRPVRALCRDTQQ
jgi:hypothetical protein